MFVNQNIKIGTFLIICSILFELFLLSFLKIEIISTGLITFENSSIYLTLDKKNNSYIQKNNVNKIKIIYQEKYYPCKIYFQNNINDLYIYFLTSNVNINFIDISKSVNLLIDEINIYQYYLRK